MLNDILIYILVYFGHHSAHYHFGYVPHYIEERKASVGSPGLTLYRGLHNWTYIYYKGKIFLNADKNIFLTSSPQSTTNTESGCLISRYRNILNIIY